MSIKALFAIPGDLETLTGGYGYDRRVLALLPACGVAVEHARLPDNFPFPARADIDSTVARLRAAPTGSVLLVDGLAFCALPGAAIDSIPHEIVAMVHHPLGYEAGLTPEQSHALVELERAALARARHVVVTSEPTRDSLLADFGVPATRITVAEPGTDRAPRAAGGGADGPVLLSVGSIVPRKAFNVLIDALAGLREMPWRLRIAGSPERDPPTAAALRAQIAGAGLGERVDLIGELGPEELERAYHGADIFVMSSLYEGYGMALAEAMARGLPVVTTTGGAAAKTVPDGAGLKVAPGDADALRDALAAVMADTALRARLGEGSWRAGQALPRWEDTAARVAAVIKQVAGMSS